MIIHNIGEIPEHVRKDGVKMTDFFGPKCPAGAGVSVGYAVFPPGTVVPKAAHKGDEYSYIISGKVICESNGIAQELSAGGSSFIPAGEVHESRNESGEEATLVWMLVEQ